MKQVTRYEAFDGTLFETEVQCLAHDADRAHLRLIGLTEERVLAAMNRADLELADAIEVVGAQISRARRAAGEMKRKRSPKPSDQLTGPVIFDTLTGEILNEEVQRREVLEQGISKRRPQTSSSDESSRDEQVV
jgi:hypothetical protein